MKNMWLALLLMGIVGILRADDSSLKPISLPAGFALAKMPAFSKWRIVFSFAETQPAPGSGSSTAKPAPKPILPVSLTVTRTKPLWHSELTDSDGNTSECWGDGAFIYLGAGAHVLVVRTNTSITGKTDFGSNSKFLNNYNKFDYFDLDFVSPHSCQGSQNGRLLFKSTGKLETTVWVDAATRIPIVWKQADQTRTYQILSAPTEMLVLPPGVKKAREGVLQASRAFSSPPPDTSVFFPTQ